MRLRSEHQLTTKGGLVVLGDEITFGMSIPPTSLLFSILPQKYKLYAGDEFIVLDGAPRVLRPGGRSDLSCVGSVEIPSGNLLIADGDLLPPEVRTSPAVFQNRFFVTDLVVWVEEKEVSTAAQCRILCVGPEMKLLMAGPEANTIHEIERQLARVLRMKGRQKKTEMDELRKTVLDLHWAGAKDKRLGLIASALRIELPHRGKLKNRNGQS
jgi:hypothetical protein